MGLRKYMSNQGETMEEDAPTLRRYNPKKQSVEFRQANRGKTITDNLPGMQIDGDLLDLYSEIDPLPDTVGAMQDKKALTVEVEIPKWSKRKKMKEYGWGAVKAIMKMEIGQRFFRDKVNEEKQEDLGMLKEEIREYAGGLGYICGFTRVDRRFIAKAQDEKFPYDTAIVLGMEMDKDLLDEVPYPKDRLFDFETYIKSGKAIFRLGEYIRSKGYKCFVRISFDPWVKWVPHAVMAGLAELGANGVAITKEFGPRVRWAMISIDAEIEPDKPSDLSMAAFCDACRVCIRACPGKAIPEERIWWRGVFKRKLNDTKCYTYFKKYEGCGICLKVCPINRVGYTQCMEAFRKDGAILAR